jgi:hypothetical protein
MVDIGNSALMRSKKPFARPRGQGQDTACLISMPLLYWITGFAGFEMPQRGLIAKLTWTCSYLDLSNLDLFNLGLLKPGPVQMAPT